MPPQSSVESEATTRKTLTEREAAEEAFARKRRAISRVDRERKRHCLHARLLKDASPRSTKPAEMMLGYSQQELLGMNIADVLAYGQHDCG